MFKLRNSLFFILAFGVLLHPVQRECIFAADPVAVHPEILKLQESFSQVAEALKPAVVNITAVHVERYQEVNPFEFFFWDQQDPFQMFPQDLNPMLPRRGAQGRTFERKIPATGSGVIIDPAGIILTNEHVVRGAEEIQVTLPGALEKKLPGKVIGRDQRTDLAVIKIQSQGNLPYAPLGDSSKIKVGDWAIAIGSPFGLEQTVTVGIISASRQNLVIGQTRYQNMIQTDAAINPGNSGGPLLNIRGEVIGINTAIYTPSGGFAGIGFAIPINLAKEIIPQLREKGKVSRGWLGVILENSLDQATAQVFGVEDGKGALLRQVLPGSPAEKSGLRRGDIVRSFNGQTVNRHFDLQNFVAAAKPNSKVELKIIRNRKPLTLFAQIGETPDSLPQVQATPAQEQPEVRQNQFAQWLGATVRDLTAEMRKELSLPDQESGVWISAVESGSIAEKIGLLPKDLIRAINQEPLANLAEFKNKTSKINAKNGVVFDIMRKGELLYLSYIATDQ